MPNNLNRNEKFVRITLTTARYILDTTRDLVSWLHGGNYDPERGIIIPSSDGNPIPSLYTQQDQTDEALHEWLSQASMVLKLIAGIVSFELQRVGDGDENNIAVLSGSDDEPRLIPPVLYDRDYYTYDEESDNIVYGAQGGEIDIWNDENGDAGEI